MKRYLLLIVFVFPLCRLYGQWGSQSFTFPDARDGILNFVINDTAYLGAGILSKDFYRFNEGSRTFTKLNDVADGSKRCFAAAFESGGYGYVVGGDSAFGKAMKDVWKYNPAADTWMQLNDFPGGKRVGMVSWKAGGRIFIGGGCDNFDGNGYGTVYKDLYEYFPATDTWTRLADLPEATAFASCFVIGQKMYFVNGASDVSTYSNSLYETDVQTISWQARAPYPGSKGNAGVGFSMSGYGYAGLGQQGFGTTFKDFYRYDPAGNRWIRLADYPDIASGWTTAFVLHNKAYVGTGLEFPAFDFSDRFYVYESLNTSLKEESKDALFSIYCIPATDIITIFTGEKAGLITIYDMTGKQVSKLMINAGENTNITMPGKGIYVACFTSGGISRARKMVVE